MSENKQKTDDTQLLFLGLVILVIGGAYIWERIKPALWAWYFTHRISIAMTITGVIVMTLYCVYQKVGEKIRRRLERREITNSKASDAVYMGQTVPDNKPVKFKIAQRIAHIQTIGTTDRGKTESVVAPLAISDIESGRGLVLIDGKAGSKLVDKLYAYAVKAGRAKISNSLVYPIMPKAAHITRLSVRRLMRSPQRLCKHLALWNITIMALFNSQF